MLRSGDLPLSQLWPHLVLGLLLARREAPPENRHLDELWRLVNRLDNPGKVAPAAAALAEKAWITRRPDPRLDEPLVAGLSRGSFAGRDDALAPLRRWSRRLAAAGIQQVGRRRTGRPRPVPEDQPYERALACGTPGRPTTCWRRFRCSTLSTPARWRRSSGRGCASRASAACPAAARRPPGPIRPG